MLKKLSVALVLVIVVLGGAAYFVGSNLDSIVKAAVEKFGSAATKATVSLDSVKITLKDGKGTLSGLSIGNPSGFTTPRAFYLGSITVQIDPASLPGTGPIVIKEISINKPQITYEVTSSGSSNLQAIASNAKTFSGAKTTPAAKEEKAKEEPKESARKIIINDLYIREGQVGISHALLQGKAMSTQMPNVHLSNIGKDKGGATPAQIAELLLGVTTNYAAQAASVDLNKELSALKGKALDAVSNKLMGVFGK